MLLNVTSVSNVKGRGGGWKPALLAELTAARGGVVEQDSMPPCRDASYEGAEVLDSLQTDKDILVHRGIVWKPPPKL